jgi:4-aminobutyrate aminotransferase-like enzyme
MSNFSNLLQECEYLKQARGYGMLEAIEFILDYEEEYPSEIRRELKQFMRDGARLFAVKGE